MGWIKTGNIQGPAGPAGPQGPEGVAGQQGPGGPQGPQGVQGVTGTAGTAGAQGAAGTGITFFGSVATEADLPADAEQGAAYLVAADDSLWINDGADFVSGGSIQGPPGQSGTPGEPGATGTRGNVWHSITGSPVSSLTAGNIAGDQAVDTVTGDVWSWT